MNNIEEEKDLKSIGVISIMTFFSRILGLVRETVFGYFFGTTTVAALFIIAFRFPNFLRQLFAEGALSSAFIPVFSEYLSQKDKKEILTVVNVVLSTLSILLILVTIFGIFFSPFIAQIVTLFSPELLKEKLLLINLLQFLFPYIFFVSISALFMGILHSYRHFFSPTLAPIMLNIALISSLFLICPFLGSSLEEKIYGLVIGVIIGGLLQVLVQVPSLLKKGIRFKLIINFSHPAIKKILKLICPSVIGLSAMQINMLVDTMLACKLGAYAVTGLNYGHRVMLFAVGMFGISIVTVLFPQMSICAAKNDIKGLKNIIQEGLKLSFLIMFPISLVLIVLCVPIIKILFQRGKFDSLSTLVSATALLYYSIGLFAYTAVKIIVRVFYALKDALTPFKVSMLCIIVNISLSLILMYPLKHGGLALSTSLTSFLNLFLLLFLLKKKIGGIKLKNIYLPYIKILICSLIFFVFCLLALFNLTKETTFSILVLKFILTIIFGAIVFIFAGILFKIEEIKKIMKIIIKNGFRRKNSKTTA